MSRRETKLIHASNLLGKYFGLTNIQDLLTHVALEQVASFNLPIGVPAGGSETQTTASTNQERLARAINAQAAASAQTSVPIRSEITEAKRKIISLIVDTGEGARTTANIIRSINTILTAGDDVLRTELGRLAQIHYGGGDRNFSVSSDDSNGVITHITAEAAGLSIREIMGNVDHSLINCNIGAPDKEHPGLSVILSNSTRVSLQQRFINPTVLFLNAIPNVELQRATPIASVEFVVARPPLSADGRIQSIGLPKFLLGAEQVSEQNTALHGMVTANSLVATPGSTAQSGEQLAKTVGGMELFTSPQTLVNADQFEVPNAVRGNPVLDKFRPFMSLNEINISVVPSTGIMSFKTARLTFVLHDRSRLHEVAEFVRPDFYSTNEVLIEYGWSHPDGEKENTDNPYGDLLNGLRVKEKFMIRNSSFSMDEAGQIIINLDLAMRGATDFDTEVISSDEHGFGAAMHDIQELEEAVAMYRERLFPEGTTTRQREIRGVQVLNAAQDARSHLTFTPEFRTQLRDLLRSLGRTSGDQVNPNARALSAKITELFGASITRRGNGNSQILQAGENSAADRLRRAVIDQITDKIVLLTNGKDPFLVPLTPNERTRGPGRSRTAADGRSRTAGSATGEQRQRVNELTRQLHGTNQQSVVQSVGAQDVVSLAKLLLHFIGEPLAATKHYDDVQLLFYPFNNCAGAARRLNVGNFVINLSYFADEFARYRLGHIGRDGNMTLRQFMSFLQEIIIDDPAAPSYGLDGIFEIAVSADGTHLSTRTRLEAPAYQTRMETKMKSYGIPSGRFCMPQVDFYIEALPERLDDEEGVDSGRTNEKTILRIHIFDKTATTYESVGSILSAARNSTITTLGEVLGPEQQDVGNSSVTHLQTSEYSELIQLATDLELIKIENRDSEGAENNSDPTIRFVGRSNETLKQFIMSTVPYIIYGAGTTAVKNASLSSLQEPNLSTVNMLRSFQRREELRPNGEQPGGLPMKIIPMQLTMKTYGCPIISFAQQFFIDFQTGTTADNIYAVTGLSHRFTPGEFDSEIKFVALDSFGQYDSLLGRIASFQAQLDNTQREADEAAGGAG